jgi:hypothetical protein
MGWMARIRLAWISGSPVDTTSHQTQPQEGLLSPPPLVGKGRGMLQPKVGKGPTGKASSDSSSEYTRTSRAVALWTIPEFAAKRQVSVEQALREVWTLNQIGLVAWAGMSASGEPAFQRTARATGAAGEN